MWKLYENFHIFHFQKRIVSLETIYGNTVGGCVNLGATFGMTIICKNQAFSQEVVFTSAINK